MFHYSMVKFVRGHSVKLDRPLRDAIISLYKPLRFVPCFLHGFIEKCIRSKKKLSVIIEFEPNPFFFNKMIVEHLFQLNTKCAIKNEFAHIDCCSALITPDGLEMLITQCSQVKKVYLNRMIKALDTGGAHQDINVHEPSSFFNTSKLTGKGVTIAIIDTGVYEHEDLQGRLRAFVDFVNNRTRPYDDNGHGTHCAGNAAGNGHLSKGKYKSLAPEADIIAIKVLDRTGTGTIERIIQGLDWCIKFNQTHKENPIQIISLSLGTHAMKYAHENEDPLVKMVEAAWRSGITVLIAAGNSGPERCTISSPGVSERAITVGALDDTIYPAETADFSSRGPTIYGKPKPDILVQGVDVISLRVPGSYIDRLEKKNRIDKHYSKMSGTSMSTPICAGAVALLLHYNRTLSPDAVKKLLISGSVTTQANSNKLMETGHLNIEQSIHILKSFDV
ncbi:S8 family peptidase [Alkalicoccobacillus porphyridii]|nr:S8 family peptidase [Alkalicoccobacillus porphyridii]